MKDGTTNDREMMVSRYEAAIITAVLAAVDKQQAMLGYVADEGNGFTTLEWADLLSILSTQVYEAAEKESGEDYVAEIVRLLATGFIALEDHYRETGSFLTTVGTRWGMPVPYPVADQEPGEAPSGSGSPKEGASN